MNESVKKIDQVFRLSDSTVNSYGYRLLTSGYLIDEFAKNPIGYYMHGTPEFPREAGILIKWEELQIAGDNITAKPIINLYHPRGQRTADEVNSGFLSAASLGHFVVLEASEEKSLMLPGQTGPTIIKWFNRECSLVDVPGNFNALTELYDKDNNPLSLSNLSSGSVIIHRPTIISAYVPERSQAQPAPAVISPELARAAAKQVSNLLSDAYSNKIINDETLQSLRENYADKPEKLPALLEVLAINKCQLELRSKSYEELDRSNGMELLHLYDRVGYNMKYFEKFKVFPPVNALSAADKATVQQTKNEAEAALLERLSNMSLQELDRCEHIQWLVDNAPVVYAGKYLFEYDKEPPMVAEKGLDRKLVKAEADKERQRYIERLKNMSYLQLDKQGHMALLKVAAPEVYREKFKEQFGNYPTN